MTDVPPPMTDVPPPMTDVPPPMTDVPPPSPVSARSRLLGLAALAAIAFVVAFVWRRTTGTPDTARVVAASVAARPHFAALDRCLLGAPLARGEKAGQRLRNIVLANETLPPDTGWPRRCAAHAQAAIRVLAPVRTEDPRVDQLVAALYSAHIALSHGRAPTGLDALWTAAGRVAVSGGTAPSSVVAARAPLRPLSGAEAATAVLGPRLERVREVAPGRLSLRGAATRFCKIEGVRIVCSDGPTVPASVGLALVPRAPAGPSASAAAPVRDLLLEQTGTAPARLFSLDASGPIPTDAAPWTAYDAGGRVYGAYSQRGGAVVLRGGRPRSTAILVESFPTGVAPSAELRAPFPLVLPPRVVAGFAVYAYADMRPRRAPPAGVGSEVGVGARIGVAWLPDDAGARRPPPAEVRLPTLPVQVLGCALPSGRALAFVTATRTESDEQLPRNVEVHFYDAQGASSAVVRGELPGSAAVIDCVGESVALLARKQVLAEQRRSLQLAGLRCTTAGCAGSAVTFARMNDVPDAITLSDDRVLVVYRTAAAGGLRARIAPLAELGRAREHVLADEAAFGGVESTGRWLVRDGDGALLVLETRAGVVVLRFASDGSVTLLRP